MHHIYQSRTDRLWHARDCSKSGHIMKCGQDCSHENIYMIMETVNLSKDIPPSETCFKCFPECTRPLPPLPRKGYEYAPDLSIDPQHDIWATIDKLMAAACASHSCEFTPINRKKFPLRIDQKVLHGNQTIYTLHLQGHSYSDFIVFPTNMADHSLDCSNL